MFEKEINSPWQSVSAAEVMQAKEEYKKHKNLWKLEIKNLSLHNLI